MADNLDRSNSFSANGSKYLLHISLYCNTSNNQQIHSLNVEDIMMFEYTNTANKLYVEASITYSDRYGIIDKYLHKQYAYCDIMFCKLASDDSEDISEGQLLRDQSFVHKFFVSNVQILNRLNSVIQYKIGLISCNWLNCVATLTYSNYDKPPESVLDLVKKMISLNNLDIDDDTFGKVKSQVKINFITNGNDNTLTTVKYLLARQYYYQKKDDCLKFVYYHDINNKYCIFDLKDLETVQTAEQILISLFNTQNETLLSQQPLNIASITKFQTNRLFKGLYDKKVTDFDYQHNVFVDKPIKEKDLLDIYNKHFPLQNYQDRFEDRFSSTMKYESRTTFWNSKMLEEIYSNMMQTFMDDNSIVINTNGNIARKPSSIVMVNVDRQMQMLQTDAPESLDDLKNKYKAYEGHWVAVKVHHMIAPHSGDKAYRQNIVLTRNFVPKDTNERAKLAS